MRTGLWATALLSLALAPGGCEEDTGIWETEDDDAGDDDAGDDDAADDDSGDDDAGDDDTSPPLDAVYLWPPLEFGDVLLGCDDAQTMQLVNGTDVSVEVSALEFDPVPDEATVVLPSPPPYVVPAGGAVPFEVIYAPQRVAPFSAGLRAETDHPDFALVTQTVAGSGVPEHDWMDGFTAPEASLVDILWVVDNSCSMQSHQLTLGAMATAFIGFLDGEGMDYQIGVVSTDDGELQGATPIIDPGTPKAAEVFAATVELGTGGSGQEQPLEFALQAVTPPLHAPGGANEGFVRTDAGLAVILLTDEPDQSPSPVGYYVNELIAVKGNPDRLAVSAVYNAQTVCKNVQETAPRIDQAVADTGGAGVCIWDQDWMPVLSTIPAAVMAPQDRFELTFEPMPETIEVTVDGNPSTDWVYDPPPANAVVFDPGAIPEPGSEILVYYVEPAESC